MLFCNKCITPFVQSCVKVERQARAWQSSPAAMPQQDWAERDRGWAERDWGWAEQDRGWAERERDWAAQKVAGAHGTGCSSLSTELCRGSSPAAARAWHSQGLWQLRTSMARLTPGKSPAKGSESTSCLTETGCSNSSMRGEEVSPVHTSAPCMFHNGCEVCETRSLPPIPDSSLLSTLVTIGRT